MSAPTVVDIARQAALLALADPDYTYPISACWNLVDPPLLERDTDVWAASIRSLQSALDDAGMQPTEEQPLCCIIGRACLDLGIDRELLRNEDNAGDLLRSHGPIQLTWTPEADMAFDFCDHVQYLQDANNPWGEALRLAYLALETDLTDADLDALFGVALHERIDEFAHPGKADK